MAKKRKNPAAVALGRMGTKRMTREQIIEQRRQAANARWSKDQKLSEEKADCTQENS